MLPVIFFFPAGIVADKANPTEAGEPGSAPAQSSTTTPVSLPLRDEDASSANGSRVKEKKSYLTLKKLPEISPETETSSKPEYTWHLPQRGLSTPLPEDSGKRDSPQDYNQDPIPEQGGSTSSTFAVANTPSPASLPSRRRAQRLIPSQRGCKLQVIACDPKPLEVTISVPPDCNTIKVVTNGDSCYLSFWSTSEDSIIRLPESYTRGRCIAGIKALEGGEATLILMDYTRPDASFRKKIDTYDCDKLFKNVNRFSTVERPADSSHRKTTHKHHEIFRHIPVSSTTEKSLSLQSQQASEMHQMSKISCNPVPEPTMNALVGSGHKAVACDSSSAPNRQSCHSASKSIHPSVQNQHSRNPLAQASESLKSRINSGITPTTAESSSLGAKQMKVKMPKYVSKADLESTKAQLERYVKEGRIRIIKENSCMIPNERLSHGDNPSSAVTKPPDRVSLSSTQNNAVDNQQEAQDDTSNDVNMKGSLQKISNPPEVTPKTLSSNTNANLNHLSDSGGNSRNSNVSTVGNSIPVDLSLPKSKGEVNKTSTRSGIHSDTSINLVGDPEQIVVEPTINLEVLSDPDVSNQYTDIRPLPVNAEDLETAQGLEARPSCSKAGEDGASGKASLIPRCSDSTKPALNTSQDSTTQANNNNLKIQDTCGPKKKQDTNTKVDTTSKEGISKVAKASAGNQDVDLTINTCETSVQQENVTSSQAEPSSGEKTKYYCGKCGYFTGTVSHLEAHEKYEHKDKNANVFFCRAPTCHLPFNDMYSRDEHESDRHPRNASMRCPMCSMQFRYFSENTEQKLSEHRKVCTKQDICVCLICKKQFASILIFKAHMVQKHGKPTNSPHRFRSIPWEEANLNLPPQYNHVGWFAFKDLIGTYSNAQENPTNCRCVCAPQLQKAMAIALGKVRPSQSQRPGVMELAAPITGTERAPYPPNCPCAECPSKACHSPDCPIGRCLSFDERRFVCPLDDCAFVTQTKFHAHLHLDHFDVDQKACVFGDYTNECVCGKTFTCRLSFIYHCNSCTYNILTMTSADNAPFVDGVARAGQASLSLLHLVASDMQGASVDLTDSQVVDITSSDDEIIIEDETTGPSTSNGTRRRRRQNALSSRRATQAPMMIVDLSDEPEVLKVVPSTSSSSASGQRSQIKSKETRGLIQPSKPPAGQPQVTFQPSSSKVNQSQTAALTPGTSKPMTLQTASQQDTSKKNQLQAPKAAGTSEATQSQLAVHRVTLKNNQSEAAAHPGTTKNSQLQGAIHRTNWRLIYSQAAVNPSMPNSSQPQAAIHRSCLNTTKSQPAIQQNTLKSKQPEAEGQLDTSKTLQSRPAVHPSTTTKSQAAEHPGSSKTIQAPSTKTTPSVASNRNLASKDDQSDEVSILIPVSLSEVRRNLGKRRLPNVTNGTVDASQPPVKRALSNAIKIIKKPVEPASSNAKSPLKTSASPQLNLGAAKRPAGSSELPGNRLNNDAAKLSHYIIKIKDDPADNYASSTTNDHPPPSGVEQVGNAPLDKPDGIINASDDHVPGSHPSIPKGTQTSPQQSEGGQSPPQLEPGSRTPPQPADGVQNKPQNAKGAKRPSQVIQEGTQLPPQIVEGPRTPPQLNTGVQNSPHQAKEVKSPPQVVQEGTQLDKGPQTPPQPTDGVQSSPQHTKGAKRPHEVIKEGTQLAKGPRNPPQPADGVQNSPKLVKGLKRPPQVVQEGTQFPPQLAEGLRTPPQPANGVKNSPQLVKGAKRARQVVKEGTQFPPQLAEGLRTPPRPTGGVQNSPQHTKGAKRPAEVVKEGTQLAKGPRTPPQPADGVQNSPQLVKGLKRPRQVVKERTQLVKGPQTPHRPTGGVQNSPQHAKGAKRPPEVVKEGTQLAKGPRTPPQPAGGVKNSPQHVKGAKRARQVVKEGTQLVKGPQTSLRPTGGVQNSPQHAKGAKRPPEVVKEGTQFPPQLAGGPQTPPQPADRVQNSPLLVKGLDRLPYVVQEGTQFAEGHQTPPQPADRVQNSPQNTKGAERPHQVVKEGIQLPPQLAEGPRTPPQPADGVQNSTHNAKGAKRPPQVVEEGTQFSPQLAEGPQTPPQPADGVHISPQNAKGAKRPPQVVKEGTPFSPQLAEDPQTPPQPAAGVQNSPHLVKGLKRPPQVVQEGTQFAEGPQTSTQPADGVQNSHQLVKGLEKLPHVVQEGTQFAEGHQIPPQPADGVQISPQNAKGAKRSLQLVEERTQFSPQLAEITQTPPQPANGVQISPQNAKGAKRTPQVVEEGTQFSPQLAESPQTRPQPADGVQNSPQNAKEAKRPPQVVQVGTQIPPQLADGSRTPPQPADGVQNSPQHAKGSKRPPQVVKEGTQFPPQLAKGPRTPQPADGVQNSPQLVKGAKSPPQVVEGSTQFPFDLIRGTQNTVTASSFAAADAAPSGHDDASDKESVQIICILCHAPLGSVLSLLRRRCCCYKQTGGPKGALTKAVTAESPKGQVFNAGGTSDLVGTLAKSNPNVTTTGPTSDRPFNVRLSMPYPLALPAAGHSLNVQGSASSPLSSASAASGYGSASKHSSPAAMSSGKVLILDSPSTSSPLLDPRTSSLVRFLGKSNPSVRSAMSTLDRGLQLRLSKPFSLALPSSGRESNVQGSTPKPATSTSPTSDQGSALKPASSSSPTSDQGLASKRVSSSSPTSGQGSAPKPASSSSPTSGPGSAPKLPSSASATSGEKSDDQGTAQASSITVLSLVEQEEKEAGLESDAKVTSDSDPGHRH